jgi:hypothetical protein
VKKIVTLLTDFGDSDGYVAALKGVVLSLAPEAVVVDAAHHIPAQDIRSAAWVLGQYWRTYPAGTVHLAVVDPGVGTARRPLALRLGGWYFVGPDNGLFTPVLEDAEKNGWPVEIVHLTNPRTWLPSVSRTFHGRDLFAPVAAHLANGVPLADLGPAVRDPVRLALPRPEKTPAGWRAHIISIDTFGNLVTDLPAGEIVDRENVLVRIGGTEIRGVVESYGQKSSGELVALISSDGRLEVAVVNGSAAQRLGAKIGDILEVILGSSV